MISVKTKFVHTAPRKIRLILDAIRGLPVSAVDAKLQFMAKQSSRDVYSTFKSAMGAAKDQGFTSDNWVVLSAYCNEGPRLKRRTMISRGRARGINKQMSHIHITIGAKTDKSSDVEKIQSSKQVEKESL